MNSQDFRRRELIGLEVEVIESTCQEHLGIKGRVVDESKNTFTIEQGGREKMVPKDCCKFRFAEGEGSYERYEKRTNSYLAHAPSCIHPELGDSVSIMECRPLSKRVSYVVIENKKQG
nr:SSU ribosomal protein S17P [uncultured archaeon]